MEIDVLTQSGNKLEERKLKEDIFGVKFNSDVVYQTLRSLLSNQRQPLAFTKDRSEVRGGGKKPWAQKGTGRARHGSIRSPLWKGGGVTFGPRQKEENFKKVIPKKMRNLALAMILTKKLQDREIIVVDKIQLEQNKTKFAHEILKNLLKENINKSKLIVLSKEEWELNKTFRNLSRTDCLLATDLNILPVLNHRFIIFTKKALETLENKSSK
ncbi:MAG: 50S ribosomal protein L4 [Minisyncoccia bacterium]